MPQFFEILRRSHRGVVLAASALCLVLSPGCQEFVHMGQISDRESASSINEVRIEQQRTDGTWRLLGKTDGNGRWWIMKSEIKGGGRIRIIRPGYEPRSMTDTDFLQQSNILLQSMQEKSDGFDSPGWNEAE